MTQLQLRVMTPDDVPFADALRQAEGWNQLPADWLRLLAHEPEGCFVATWNGRLAGTVTTTVHSGRLGWIGMMLVDRELRRRGIASALMERSLEYLTGRGVPCIKLDATPAGQPVYEKLGFKAEWPWQRRELPGDVNPAIIPGGNEWCEPDWDAEVFGAGRHPWLARIFDGAHVVAREQGYGMIRPGTNAGYLGPVAATDPQTAEDIIRTLLATHPGRYLWDIPSPNSAGVALAESLGFRPIRDLLRMWTGTELIEGRPEHQYALADPGTG